MNLLEKRGHRTVSHVVSIPPVIFNTGENATKHIPGNAKENTTYCNNKVTVMMGEGSFYFPPQDLLLSWRKATGIISTILVIYILKLHGGCVALLQLSNNQSFNKHFSMCKML